MANVLVEETSLTNIANAIRNKNGTAAKYKPSEMANAISQITTSEDLTSELTEQNTLITTQETTIDDIVTALQGKSAGGGDTSLEDSFMAGSITHYRNDRITLTSQYCLAGRNNLITVEFPNVKELQTRACFMCSNLERIELDNIERFYSGVFYGNYALKSVVIRTSTVATLVARDVFSNSAIASGTGYVYVLDNLVEQYKNSSNWSDIASQIKGVSEL
jgi:hypothetical protein